MLVPWTQAPLHSVCHHHLQAHAAVHAGRAARADGAASAAVAVVVSPCSCGRAACALSRPAAAHAAEQASLCCRPGRPGAGVGAAPVAVGVLSEETQLLLQLSEAGRLQTQEPALAAHAAAAGLAAGAAVPAVRMVTSVQTPLQLIWPEEQVGPADGLAQPATNSAEPRAATQAKKEIVRETILGLLMGDWS